MNSLKYIPKYSLLYCSALILSITFVALIIYLPLKLPGNFFYNFIAFVIYLLLSGVIFVLVNFVSLIIYLVKRNRAGCVKSIVGFIISIITLLAAASFLGTHF